jgi:hypothetical protein
MSGEPYMLVGEARAPGPRGVAVVVNGTTIVVGVRVARETAQMLMAMAQLVEDTGGASPEIENGGVRVDDKFIEAQGFKTAVRS